MNKNKPLTKAEQKEAQEVINAAQQVYGVSTSPADESRIGDAIVSRLCRELTLEALTALDNCMGDDSGYDLEDLLPGLEDDLAAIIRTAYAKAEADVTRLIEEEGMATFLLREPTRLVDDAWRVHSRLNEPGEQLLIPWEELEDK